MFRCPNPGIYLVCLSWARVKRGPTARFDSSFGPLIPWLNYTGLDASSHCPQPRLEGLKRRGRDNCLTDCLGPWQVNLASPKIVVPAPSTTPGLDECMFVPRG